MFLSWIGDAISKAVTNWWNDFVSHALYGISRILCSIVYAIEQVYFYLLGTKEIPNKSGNIFEQIFENSEITRFIFIFIGVAFTLWIICFLVSIIKGMLNQDTPGATKKAIVNSIKAIIGIVVIPTMCFIFFTLSMRLITYMVNQLNGGTGGSIAKYLWEAGYKDSSTIYEGIGDGARIPFNLDYDVLNGLEFNTPSGSHGSFMNIGSTYHMDYFIVILGSLVLGVCMSIATIKICGRLINIVILYAISPVVVATMSVDDGKRFEAWKEISISKLFSIMGSVLAMYIYIILLQVVGKASSSIMEANNGDPAVLNVIAGIAFYLICAIAGALMVIKGTDMLDSIVSQNAGGLDGLSPMGMASLGRVLGRGLGKIGGKGKNALFGKSQNNKSGSAGQANNGGSAGQANNGAFSNPSGHTNGYASLKNKLANSPLAKASQSLKQNGLVGSLINAGAGIGGHIADSRQSNKLNKDLFNKPTTAKAVRQDKQRYEQLKKAGISKNELDKLKKQGFGSDRFKSQAMKIADKYKKDQEKGVYR